MAAHLANSGKANDVVKELHWRVQNHFGHFGDAGLSMLGFDPLREVDPSQLGFGFDDFAKTITEQALMKELPARIRADHPYGVSFSDLFAELANETPATRNMLRQILTNLCREGELAKCGSGGENRQPTTVVRDDDVIEQPRQIRLFGR